MTNPSDDRENDGNVAVKSNDVDQPKVTQPAKSSVQEAASTTKDDEEEDTMTETADRLYKETYIEGIKAIIISLSEKVHDQMDNAGSQNDDISRRRIFQDAISVVTKLMKIHDHDAGIQLRLCEFVSLFFDYYIIDIDTKHLIQSILVAMDKFPDDSGLQRSACWALESVCREHDEGALDAGIVPALMKVMDNHPADGSVQDTCRHVFGKLLEGASKKAKFEIIREGFVPIVKSFRSAIYAYNISEEDAFDAFKKLVNGESE